jgi:hypothetical protein
MTLAAAPVVTSSRLAGSGGHPGVPGSGFRPSANVVSRP